MGAGKEAAFHEINAVDDNGKTALHGACQDGYGRAVEELVERAGREIDLIRFAAKDQEGFTSFHYARQLGCCLERRSGRLLSMLPLCIEGPQCIFPAKYEDC
jgi:hypothetical protein